MLGPYVSTLLSNYSCGGKYFVLICNSLKFASKRKRKSLKIIVSNRDKCFISLLEKYGKCLSNFTLIPG